MGEVAAANENGAELLQVQETGVVGQQADKSITAEEGAGAATAAAEGGDLSAVRWKRFLPKMVVRVLLVEADDSTRQIIAALLRKCSYRVAAVSDGLQAWEVLKGRSHNIDLILTEVELPSISGYALLTLVMEHDLCKNIPVIMMSSQDSVSTVYKCMLRGAADFLVKPVRKNELKNLWQHVWRRQASSSGAGPGPPEESVAQQKVEATAENNETNNHSSGYMACVQRNRECIEKGSDAQSSCTKPELETEGADIEHNHCLSRPETDKRLPYNDLNLSTQEKCLSESRELLGHDTEAGESRDNVNLEMNYAATREQDKNSDDAPKQDNVVGPSSENNNMKIFGNSSREAIDLIGAFDNYPKGNFRSSFSNASMNKFDILPHLDLSLRRCHPSSSVNQINDDSRRLNHSDTSAFSRYINKPVQAQNSTSPSRCNQHKEHETNSEKQFSNHTPDYNSDAHGQAICSRKHVPLATTIQPVWPEITFPYPQQRQLSHPIPVRGVRLFENLTNGYGSPAPRIYCAQSGVSPLPSPGTATQSEPFPRMNLFYASDGRPLSSSQQLHNLMDNNNRMNNPIDQMDSKQGQKFEKLDVSSANDQSGNSSFYNSNTSYYHSADSGSNGTILTVNGRSECGNEEVGLNRSSQREAALTKFRLKRKGRCFEKKVRYESRKKLAEQRPRVKGQFVRQVTSDPQPWNSPAG